MKKRKSKTLWILGIYLLVISLSALAISFVYVTQYQEKEKTITELKTDTDVHEESSLTEEQPITWTNYSVQEISSMFDTTSLSIGVSSVLEPLTRNLQEIYPSTQNNGIFIENTTEENIIGLLDGIYDIIFVPESTKELLELQDSYNTSLEYIPIAKDALVFFVSYENPVYDLYVEDLQNIYSGKIPTWDYVNGEEWEIIAYQKPENTILQSVFHNLVLTKEKTMEPPTEIKLDAENSMIELISPYHTTKNAIGYNSYYYMKDILFENRIKLLSIDGIPPTKTNSINGIYPLTMQYYAVLREDTPLDAPERILLQYLLSDIGQSIISESGYLPLYEIE